MRPSLRNVLLSSYQITSEGPVLVQPFEMTTEQEKQLADLVEQQIDEYQARFVRDMLARLDQDNDRSR
ncbi:MAG: hypothetical protein K2Y37_19075 [Pirellulales bacterium]|nr:hypothetical protein [Pirellulales bacterium]